ncbi:hypothetical protein F2Q69_00000582 [Brassica cretica]|uniref:RING-type E3 ubiquitin transferase n=1 Tax=Brassica cretica TaxID=69181 RepID=A0A8S9P1R6_BRACR|nr:hypothetical protein F2Q69_00000582 [Brassica cretica]
MAATLQSFFLAIKTLSSLAADRESPFGVVSVNHLSHFNNYPVHLDKQVFDAASTCFGFCECVPRVDKVKCSWVTEALARAGLESSNLIVGIDFTKSNEWTGARSFNRKSLHFIGNNPNPYEQAITIIGRTLAAFDEDNLIPCYGFGDALTHDQDVFSFNPEDRFCNGFEEVLGRYKEIVPQLKLAGPTSFAPIIDMAMTIVEQSGGQYHVLVIIADGQVTRSVDTENGQLSPQEQKTVEAIVQASKLPLSIVLVGVGDGPWDMMREFDDNIPSRAFDNFQFVNFTEIMSKNKAQSLKETEFALSALMEIPQQYKATLELSLLGRRRNGNIQERFPLPPPMHGGGSSFNNKPKTNRIPSFKPSVPPYPTESYPVRSSPAPPPATTSASDNQLCPICLSNPKDMAFGCGHQALARAGLESSNLIVGIDFTKSNEWTGARSFNRKSLHYIGNNPNPYEQAITIIGRTLAAFDEDNLIPCYGFGDASTHDQDVFSFNPEDSFCNGFEEVLGRYKEIVPQLKLAGPTSFAPIIDMAMTIVEQSGGQYHVLVIIADGQVTRSVDTENGQLSPQEQKTVEAIVQASKLPLSIVLVGVGDGPWDMMREFDDNIPSRAFDNFQFVNFTEIMSKNKAQSLKETEFALSALMEIPQQYKATLELNLLGRRNGNIQERFPLPPPMHGGGSSYNNKPKANRVPSFKPSVPPYPTESYPVRSSPAPPPATTSASDNQLCPICLSNPKDMAFGCGHQIPQQYKATLELSLLGRRRNGNIQERFPLPPPMHGGGSSFNNKPKTNRIPSFKPSVPPYPTESYPVRSSPAPPPATTSASDNQLCPICLSNPKDMAFGCGHQTCCECGPDLEMCPICRAPIQTRIKLY